VNSHTLHGPHHISITVEAFTMEWEKWSSSWGGHTRYGLQDTGEGTPPDGVAVDKPTSHTLKSVTATSQSVVIACLCVRFKKIFQPPQVKFHWVWGESVSI